MTEPREADGAAMWLTLCACVVVHGTLLNHRYVALRHGQSEANVQGIISSEPSVAVVQHGLSASGRAQAQKAGVALVELAKASGCGLAVVTSDFKRALETAQAVHEAAERAGVPTWPSQAPQIEVRLRERYFGEFNGESDDNYGRVWAEDAVSAQHEAFGVESVASVVARTGELLSDLDASAALRRQEQKWLVCLVAHGDVLQIMQCAHFERQDPRLHRHLEHLLTATPRELGTGLR